MPEATIKRRNCEACGRTMESVDPICKWCLGIMQMETRNELRGLIRKKMRSAPSIAKDFLKTLPQGEHEKQMRSRHRNGRRGRSGCFVQTAPSQFITLSQLHRDTLRLASLVPPETDTIIGVARSGLAVATMVSLLLHKPLMVYQQTNRQLVPAGNGWRLGLSHIAPPEEYVTVIDDTVMTGNSTRAVRKYISQRYKKAHYAAVYCNPAARVKPDFWARDLGWPHLLEWNLFNSILTPNIGMDFDGVLCHDCPPGADDDGNRYELFIKNTRPKYVTRRQPIPLVVTARIEKYRNLTQQWLDRHQIRVTKLIMHPAKTLQERRRDDIAAFKAKHFDEWAQHHHYTPKPIMFIESEDQQARRIHQMTGRLVICPGTGKCYEGRW